MTQSNTPEFFSKQVEKAQRFYIEAPPEKSPRPNVVCGGLEETAPDFTIDRKNFPYYSIEFVAAGHGKTILNTKEFQLSPGVIFTYGPNVHHYITNNPEKTMAKYFVDFTGTDSAKCLNTYAGGLGTAFKISRPDEIKAIFDDIIKHGQSDSPYKSRLCATLLEYLFLRIAETKITEQTTVLRALTTYQNCRQYIRENFIALNSLDDIAESCMIDKAYICRLFKRFDTVSPYHYLLNLKMAYAADRLHESDILVKQVAAELGFSDPFHFTRAFKKVFGICPQEFKGLRAATNRNDG